MNKISKLCFIIFGLFGLLFFPMVVFGAVSSVYWTPDLPEYSSQDTITLAFDEDGNSCSGFSDSYADFIRGDAQGYSVIGFGTDISAQSYYYDSLQLYDVYLGSVEYGDELLFGVGQDWNFVRAYFIGGLPEPIDYALNCGNSAGGNVFDVIDDGPFVPPSEGATTTTYYVDNPAQNLFNMFMIMYVAMFGVIWFFRRKT